MKRVCILILGICMLLMLGCENDKTVGSSEAGEAQITETTLQRTDTFTDADIQVKFPQNTGNADIDADIRNWVQAQYDNAVKEVLPNGKYEYLMNYEIRNSSKNYLSVIFQSYTYTGGAHGMTTTNVLTYDIASGKRLDIKEVLASDTIVKIQKKLGEEAINKGFDNRNNEMFQDPAKMPISNLDKVVFTEKGLEFYYDPYEIAPYAAGVIVLDIDKKDLIQMGVDSKFWN